MMRLPSLSAVRHFEAAARLKSFTAAAAELHVTQGAVSRMVHTLEEQLGVRLFERKGRWISLTPAGDGYRRQLAAALNQIAQASERLRAGAQEATLTLSANVGFASLWLIPNIADFRAKHPGIQVEVLAEEQRLPEHDKVVHACIRYGTPPWAGFDAHDLLPRPAMGVVCAPEQQRSHKVRTPADLLHAPLLAVAMGSDEPWADYFNHHGLPMPDMGRTPRFLQMMMMREAALSGLGFAVVPLFLFQQDVRQGRLVQALPQTSKTRHGYHFLQHQDVSVDPKVRAFKRWLVARLAQTLHS
jgi:LysR family transcriptional regulator, glycine cleavage system transcriptional activator